MKVDPIPVVVDYLRNCPGIPADAPTGTMVGREPGDTTLYILHSGGYRVVRDAMDKAEIWYDAYHKDRASAAGLAYLTREFLLEDLPGKVINGVQILDVMEVSSPRYIPDETSLEDVYGGEVCIFYVES
ncbi:hypothetical protein [Streptomyces graminilatus]|uniref:hypothetical protein n=1 Tax=Streptomyces graminilatus TaxID=1464070 RepID=UPI000A59EB5B|nr:hypothetical protein [Streptomyces graminilatus]